MDNMLYTTVTNFICLISLIGAIVIATIFAIKKKLSIVQIFFLLIFLFGMYLYIPFKLTTIGYIYQNPKYLNSAIKLSVNPYEKRLCNKYISEIYADDIFYQGIKDGNKAIDYMERALKGNYKKYPNEAKKLMFWYSIKGDEAKTFALSEFLGTKNMAIRNIYIMKDDYKSALDTFEDNKSIENYLKADLYKKLNNPQEADNARKIAEETYKTTLENMNIRAKKLEYKESAEKYKSTENYKNWILAQRKEYSFR